MRIWYVCCVCVILYVMLYIGLDLKKNLIHLLSSAELNTYLVWLFVIKAKVNIVTVFLIWTTWITFLPLLKNLIRVSSTSVKQ